MPFKSLAQRRKFYALKDEGKMDQATINEWEKETPKKLPEHVKQGFVIGFAKHAENLAEQAAIFANYQNEAYMPGSGARENMETGQAKGRATRTQGVINEDKEFTADKRHLHRTSRGP